MFKVVSILSKATTFLVGNEIEIVELLKTFKPNRVDIFLDGNIMQVFVPAEKSLQIIAENTEKYKWAGDENDS